MNQCESCGSIIESYLIEIDGVLYNKNICGNCGNVTYQEAVVIEERETDRELIDE